MAIENTVKVGIIKPDPKVGRLRYYDPKEKITVIIEQKSGDVITVIPGEL